MSSKLIFQLKSHKNQCLKSKYANYIVNKKFSFSSKEPHVFYNK